MNIKHGFYRPDINENLCISCNKCKAVCPSVNQGNLADVGIDSKVCYASWSKNDVTHFECASGGICTEISRVFIKKGGHVAGAWWNPDKQIVEHRICKTESDLETISKSKYVQSSMEGLYKELKNDSSEILFIGVPCQINAMKQYFGKSKKISYIDILCHGGASPLAFSQHISNVADGNKVDSISFRGGVYDCNLVLSINDKIIYHGGQFVDPYFNAFMKRSIYQPICYECPFAGKNRIGDLTLGDFWGLDEKFMPSDKNRGVNLILVNTSEGERLLNSVEDKVVLIKRPVSEAIQGNDTLREATQQPPEYEKLMKTMIEENFPHAYDCYYEDYKRGIKLARSQWIKQRIKSSIKKFISKK